MGQSYILVEGVNIYANVFDTKQLSVIRGSSFLLKYAIDKISTSFSTQLQAISTGASSGLFLVTDGVDSVALTTRIVNQLNNPDEDFKLLTFIVECCIADNFLQAKEQLIAQLRIQQMQSITQVPDFIDANNTELAQPDELEGRRIAAKNCPALIQKKQRQLSSSVYQRWRQGIKLKQDYYFQEKKISQSEDLARLREYDFTGNFEELADKPDYTKLNAKIAVIYMDGNQFSKIQKVILEQAEDQIIAQQNFDNTIQHNRADFLLKLLLEMIDPSTDSGFQHALLEQKKTLRFETLLWGGDEMLFVLPAWLGFEFLQYFFQATQHWKIETTTLTHAAGLVFCSANTPINNIRDLAQSLAETVKNTRKEDSPNQHSGREQSAWNYGVLESIDYPTNNNIADFNAKHYGHFFSKPPLITATTNWQQLKPILNQLINQGLLPRRQLYRIVQTLNSLEHKTECKVESLTLSWEQIQKADKSDDTLSPQEKLEIRLLEVSEDSGALTDKLRQVARLLFALDINKPEQRLCLWVYLYDLWDYLIPQTAQ